MMKIILIVLVSELFMTVGHILFKKTTNAFETYSLRGLRPQMRFLADILKEPSIWTGFLSMVIGLIIWLIALAQGDLSVVFSIGSLQFILILFSANIFLNEKIDKMKLLGTVLVIFGIVLIVLR